MVRNIRAGRAEKNTGREWRPQRLILGVHETRDGELADLFERHRGALFNVVVGLVGAGDGAEDVLQETFLKAVQGWPCFRGDADPKTWLYRIAVNCSYTFLRKARSNHHAVSGEPPQDSNTSTPTAEHRLLREEDERRIKQALQSLRPELRSVILLREVERLSYAEIALIQGWSEGTVASRLNRARGLLARKLEQLGVYKR